MKRHTKQNIKQATGSYFTSNCEFLLSKYKNLIKEKEIIDPFAGNGDLLHWATSQGCKSVEGYDIAPLRNYKKQDTLLNPPSYDNRFVLTNPPYLCSNKNKDKTIYNMYGYNDLYKCFIASMDADEGIMILPSNFLSESSSKSRSNFFSRYRITQCDYYYYQVFPEATTGICVFHFIKDTNKPFPMRIHYSSTDIRSIEVSLEERHSFLFGNSFFDYLSDIQPIAFSRYTGKESGFLTNMVVGLLDKGKWKQGLTYNDGEVVLCGDKAFTTYQIISPIEIDKETQKQLVVSFNKKMSYYRNKYHGLFLSNYMGANQKIYNRTFVNKLLTRILQEQI